MNKRVQSLPQPPSVAATAKSKVATKSGLLLGAWEDGVQVFRGVPYSGATRWRQTVSLSYSDAMGRRTRRYPVRPASYQINTGNRQKVMGTEHVIPQGPVAALPCAFN
jgi:carboxylesterase type B